MKRKHRRPANQPVTGRPISSVPSSPLAPDANIAQASDHRTAFLIRNAVIALAGVLGIFLLIRLIFVRSYNYDELSHAHMAWLVSVGDVPYRDFAANHFPFLWILLSPLLWVLPESPATLMILRGLALLCNLVFLASLVTLIGFKLETRQRIWAAVGFGLVVFSPGVMNFLMEFRPDAIANALLFATLACISLRDSRTFLTGFVSGLCLGAAILINTKYILFPFVLGAVALLAHARQFRRLWPFAVGIGLGFGAAMLCGLLLLQGIGASLEDAWRMVVTYNELAQRNSPFGFGLARTLIIAYPWWLAYSLAGLIGCVVLFRRQRRPPDCFTVAVFIFLAVDSLTTARPWKQYVASWLILAACFPARSLPLLLARLRPQLQAAVAIGLPILLVVGFVRAGNVDPNGNEIDRQTQDRAMAWLLQHVPPDGFVVSSFNLHPVFRRDTFFKTVFDYTSQSGDGLEQIMPQLTTAPYSEHFQQSGYEKELELRPPAVIVHQQYTDAQIRALVAYLARHPDTYEQTMIPGTRVGVLEQKTKAGPEQK